MDENRSLIINLALQDADARRLFGSLLTVFAEQGALSRAEFPPTQRFNRHFLIIDEFSEFSAQSEDSLTRILNLCRKFGLFLVLAHQSWSQTNDQLKGALQNVGVEVVFKLGRSDAEYTAPLLGWVDMMKVKHEVSDEKAVDRSHPLFYSLQEGWESWRQAIQALSPREAFLQKPDGSVLKMHSLRVDEPKVRAEKLKAIEEYYVSTFFNHRTDFEQALSAVRKPPVPRTTRMCSSPRC